MRTLDTMNFDFWGLWESFFRFLHAVSSHSWIMKAKSFRMDDASEKLAQKPQKLGKNQTTPWKSFLLAFSRRIQRSFARAIMRGSWRNENRLYWKARKLLRCYEWSDRQMFMVDFREYQFLWFHQSNIFVYIFNSILNSSQVENDNSSKCMYACFAHETDLRRISFEWKAGTRGKKPKSFTSRCFIYPIYRFSDGRRTSSLSQPDRR